MPESATNPDMIRIVVPGEARPYRERAHTYIRAERGKRGQPIGSLAIGSHMPKHTQNYQALVSMHAEDAMDGRDPFDGPLRLHVRAYVSIPATLPKFRLQEIRLGLFHPCKRPDVTNVIKLAEDALQGIVFKDDKQVVRGSADTGRYFSFQPRLEIDVEPVTRCQLQADELAGDVALAPSGGDLFAAADTS